VSMEKKKTGGGEDGGPWTTIPSVCAEPRSTPLRVGCITSHLCSTCCSWGQHILSGIEDMHVVPCTCWVVRYSEWVGMFGAMWT
jgi:hypothetical protein